jgi:hypothetical protein
MAEFPGSTAMTMIEAPVKNDAGTDTAADRDGHKASHVSSMPKEMLGQGKGIHIVIGPDGCLCPFCD